MCCSKPHYIAAHCERIGGVTISGQNRIREQAKQLLFLFLGNLLYVLALRLFFIDNRIVAGGFAGLATIINYLAPISVGNLTFLMNLPFIFIAWKMKGFAYTIKIFLSTVMFTLLSNGLEVLPVATDDRFAAAVFGGALYGFGAACVLQAKTAAGGTDLIARLLLTKFPGLSLGNLFLMVDGLIVLLAVVVFRDLETGVYALTAIAVYAITNDRIVVNAKHKDICFVITEKEPGPVSETVMARMRVGVTNVPSVGMHTQAKKNLLIVVVRPRDVEQLKKIVLEYDKGAFIFVGWAGDVTGGGFSSLHPHP